MDRISHSALAPGLPAGPAFARPNLNVSRVSGEMWVSFFTFALLLFLPQTHGTAPIFLILIYAGLAIKHPGEVLRRIRGRWVLFAPGVFAFISTFWSMDSVTTLRLSLELLFTIYMSLWLAGSRRWNDVVAGLAMAGMLYLLSSLVLGQTVMIGTVPGKEAFSGFNLGKNLFGDIAAIGILAMVALHFQTWMQRPVVTMALLLVLAIEVNAIILSQSAGAMVAAFGACAVMVFVVILTRVDAVVRAWLLIVTGLTALLGLLLFTVMGDVVMDNMMGLFHKDPTMTGRLYLWARSKDIVDSHPWLGSGYNAFWVQGNLDAEGLWTWARIPTRTGFNFHSTIIENLVEVGYVGTTILVLTVLLGAMGLLRRAIRSGQTAAAFWVAILAYELSRFPIEALGPSPFYHTTVLVWVALGMAWSDDDHGNRFARHA
ncbi:O-antigen ligase family protein [Novosphingobium sp. KACC 22771]|uniref:O-antigen ligase family protein n=1 Tax=Novosphingobium sp. KACC 22771 TaxID=3025670 RepID=UPI002366845A|nr:O-antigen ligase family protein [Novosphingobium sp. KACC 22771]WDF72964.1 O-antigen ligase family protein [Novosphingobium sp. KACC 22771]